MTEPDAARRVGPNAVIQLGVALRERLGDGGARRVFVRAGHEALIDDPPGEMVDERVAAELFAATFEALPPEQAREVAQRAGDRTAAYLLRHRIPAPVQRVLRLLPPRLAGRLLLTAIARNAWTFAGSGRFCWRQGPPWVVEIESNPLAIPGCVWHQAVFEALFRALVADDARVHQTHCCRAGDPGCRFEIAIGARPV